MKTPIITFIAIVLFALPSFAQDYIFLKNGKRLETVISEKTKSAIIYTNYGENSKAVKIVNISDIKTIAWANGKVDDYEGNKHMDEVSDFNKNLFAYHLADLLINNFTISYERILNNGKIGIQIPFSLGYGGDYQELGDFQNKFYTGINLNFYPTGQGKWRFFLGPGLRVGSGTIDDYYYNYNDYYDTHINEDVFYFKFHINNGIMYSPIPQLSLSAALSLGIRYTDSSYDDYNIKTTGAASFNMIYRF